MTAGSNSTLTDPVNIVRGTHSQLIAFLVLNIWPSHFGIPLLLTIIYFGKIERYPTFLNLCVTFMIAGFSTSILPYAGKIEGPEPSKMVCLLQASLLYGYPPMTTVAAFALVFQMFLVIRRPSYKKPEGKIDPMWLFLLLAGPYLAFLGTALVTAIVGAGNPSKVSRNRRFFYCSVRSMNLTNSITVFSAVFLLATILFEGWIILILYKRWMALRSKVVSFSGSLDLSMTVRVLAYGLYSTLALSVNLMSIKAPESPVPDLIIATAATVFLLNFGTQKDIVDAACFWRRKKAEYPNMKKESSGPILV